MTVHLLTTLGAITCGAMGEDSSPDIEDITCGDCEQRHDDVVADAFKPASGGPSPWPVPHASWSCDPDLAALGFPCLACHLCLKESRS